MSTTRLFGVSSLVLLLTTGCSEEVGDGGGGGSATGGQSGVGGEGGVDLSDQGKLLVIDVAADAASHVDLDGPPVVAADDAWELALSGYDVFTNSGVSGDADGGAFGPLAAAAFLFDEEPEYPFLITDKTGGAFLGWYAYDGTSHALWSRYHVYGVDTGEQRFKVQILGYYGEVMGAPVTAIFGLRWAEVTSEGVGPTQTLDDLDGTAGGLGGPPDAPSGCLNLASGEVSLLPPEEALASTAWHLCFRRDVISVNGGLGGPGQVTAVDLTAAGLGSQEPLDEVMTYTAASKLAAFDAVDHAALDAPGSSYRGDRIVSAFDTRWTNVTTSPPTPASATWVVSGADGNARFLVAFEGFEGATNETPTRVSLRVKKVK